VAGQLQGAFKTDLVPADGFICRDVRVKTAQFYHNLSYVLDQVKKGDVGGGSHRLRELTM